MTNDDQHIHGIAIRDLLILLDPEYTDDCRVESWVSGGFLVMNDNDETYRWTAEGEQLVDQIRAAHGLRRGGYYTTAKLTVDHRGWALGDQDLHCGAGLEMLLRDGSWLLVRFELSQGLAGEEPRFFIQVAGAVQLDAGIRGEGWKRAIFRWPAKKPVI